MSSLSFADYRRLDALDIARNVATGDLDPAEVLEAAIRRAEEVDDAINAVVIPLFDEARAAVREGLPNGVLRGVPFLLKDLGAYLEGTRTTSGSRFFAEFVADHDSEIVRRYRAAGLVVFGKSASPEFGLITSTESALFGATRNPWNPEFSAGGSSGGAAAAVAAGILPAAHASDGGGSIRIPASCCGLFGLKPTRARTPMGPDAGEGWSGMSTVHAVSRSVRDSAALLDVAAGADVGDPYWAPPPQRPFLDEVHHGPGRLRVAFTTQAFNGASTHADCAAAVAQTAALLEELGHEVAEASPDFDRDELGRATRVVLGASTRATMERRAAELGRDFGDGDLEAMTLQIVEAARQRSAADYVHALRTIHAVGRRVGHFFESWDVLLTPTMATPPPRIGALAQERVGEAGFLDCLLQTVGFTQLMNVAGNPAASLPLAQSAEGLPIGVQLAAGFGREDIVLRLSAQVEEARPWADRLP